MNEPRPLKVKVITGLSGSGISTAIDALEDLGYFCVDNLPPPLLPKLFDLAREAERFERLAIGLDSRNVRHPEEALDLLRNARGDGVHIDTLFLEAADAVLLRRFSASRRPHPYGRHQLALPEAIRAERQAMHPFRELASRVVDTTELNVHECKKLVQGWAAGERSSTLSVSVLSFGFRHGVPLEADVVWDVRFLPNPHFVPTLRPHSGLDAGVRDFVLSRPAAERFLAHFLPLIDEALPAYEAEGKSYLTIAIGCTGGRHRSVALTERIAEHLRAHGGSPAVRHRDIDKEQT